MSTQNVDRRALLKAGVSALALPGLFSISGLSSSIYAQERQKKMRVRDQFFGLDRATARLIIDNPQLNAAIKKMDKALISRKAAEIKQFHAFDPARSIRAINAIFAELSNSGVCNSIRDLSPSVLEDFSFVTEAAFKREELRAAGPYGLTEAQYNNLAKYVDGQKKQIIATAHSKADWKPVMESMGGHGAGSLGAGGANAAMLANWENLSDIQKILAILSLLFAIGGILLG